MKNILIIGSCGFIGSNLFNFFNNLRSIDGTPLYTVQGADILPVEVALAKMQSEQNAYFALDAKALNYDEVFLQNKNFDFVINCSGAASVPLSFNAPYDDFALNTANVFALLECMRKFCKNALFINFSSAAVYGNPKKLPIKEAFECKPLSPYGFHKFYAEAICNEYSTLYGIKTISLRVFSAYGNGLQKQIFWDIVQKALQEPSVNLFGTGNETRDFIHIKDICHAINCILCKNQNLPSVINIANGEQSAIKDIARLVLDALGIDKKIVFSANTRTGDPVNWQSDISVLKSLGYKKTVLLEDGVKDYVAWAKGVNA